MRKSPPSAAGSEPSNTCLIRRRNRILLILCRKGTRPTRSITTKKHDPEKENRFSEIPLIPTKSGNPDLRRNSEKSLDRRLRGDERRVCPCASSAHVGTASVWQGCKWN